MQIAAATAFALIALAPGLTAAQTNESGQQQREVMHGNLGAEGMPDSAMDCQEMMAKKKQMQAKCEQMQAELDTLVGEMNAASGKAQQQAMAELLTKLVQQRSMMHEMRMKMQSMMMQHIMGHLKSGETAGMSGCPMMEQTQAGSGAGSSPVAGEDQS